jgi:hypothetical protein
VGGELAGLRIFNSRVKYGVQGQGVVLLSVTACFHALTTRCCACGCLVRATELKAPREKERPGPVHGARDGWLSAPCARFMAGLRTSTRKRPQGPRYVPAFRKVVSGERLRLVPLFLCLFISRTPRYVHGKSLCWIKVYLFSARMFEQAKWIQVSSFKKKCACPFQ